MRVVIAGSRSIKSYSLVCNAIYDSGFEITEIVNGLAEGPDQLGGEYGENHDLKINLYPADWKTHGKKAGFLRNEVMGNNCDAVVVIWDGVSNGSRSMIEIAKRKNLPLFVQIIKNVEEVL